MRKLILITVADSTHVVRVFATPSQTAADIVDFVHGAAERATDLGEEVLFIHNSLPGEHVHLRRKDLDALLVMLNAAEREAYAGG